MMKDGLSPYFYIWKNGSPMRYYDRTYTNANVSPATASPFLHFIMQGIADLPQLQWGMLWLWIEYFSLAGTLLFVLYALPPLQRKKMLPYLLSLVVLFTYTIGWRVHLLVGQNYIFVPFLMAGCFYFMRRPVANISSILGFAIFCVSLLLIRPVIACVFVPFLFFTKKYFKWGLVSAAVLLLYALFALSNPVQKQNWSEYFASISIHLINHQSVDLSANTLYDSDDVQPTEIESFEGISLSSFDWKKIWKDISIKGECRNFHIVYKAVTGKSVSIKIQKTIAYTCFFLLLVPLLFCIVKKIDMPLEALFCLGYAVYNIYVFCMPVTQQQYNWVEILFPLLLLPVWMKKVYIIPAVFIILGIYLNIATPDFIKFRHNIGEFFIVGIMLYLVYRPLFISSQKEQKLAFNNQFCWL